MSFVDNLRQKIAINEMADAVIISLRPPGAERHLDRKNMITLLKMAGYEPLQRRDLDLYLPDGDETRNEVLVLDNDLPLYRTTVEDVELRKSPIVKEMVNIRNIRKILVDTDVVITKQADTVNRIRQHCLDGLDLNWQPEDIRDIAALGARSLENNYSEGIVDSLTLFSELLGYKPPPKALRVAHHDIIGQVTSVAGTTVAYGPLVAFSRIDNGLRLVETTVRLNDAAAMENAAEVICGKAAPAAQGPAVFDWLASRVLSSPPVTG